MKIGTARPPWGITLGVLAGFSLFPLPGGPARASDLDQPVGLIQTIAGIGTDFTGEGGLATSTSIAARGIAFSPTGELLLTDAGTGRIRKVDSKGVLTSLTGQEPGGGDTFPYDGMKAIFARLSNPTDLLVDRDGSLLFSDQGLDQVLKVTPQGTFALIAGIVVPSDGTRPTANPNPAQSTALKSPQGIALDASGNVYIAETGNNRIRKVDPAGAITTIAGVGPDSPGSAGDNGPASAALLTAPTRLLLDGQGNLYLSDTGNNRIRKIDSKGIISTVAGTGDEDFTGDGGPATQAALNAPQGLAWDKDGNLLIADTGNNRIRRMTPQGVISTVVGNGSEEFKDTGSTALTVSLHSPIDVKVDATGSLFILDQFGNEIRAVDSEGKVSVVAGFVNSDPDGDFDFTGFDGPATVASLKYPTGVAISPSGELYISDSNTRHRIYKVDKDGIFHFVAGRGTLDNFSGDGGPASDAQFVQPYGLAFDLAGNLFVADRGDAHIRKIDAKGMVTSVAGTTDGDNVPVMGTDGDGGPANLAALFEPQGVAVDGKGNLYIADGTSGLVRKVGLDGKIQTLVGGGTGDTPFQEGLPGTQDYICDATATAVDRSGTLYIGACGSVFRLDPDGTLNTVAGRYDAGVVPHQNFEGDGGPAVKARLNGVMGLAIDSAGNIFISEYGNHLIRKVDTSGIISTVAGKPTFGSLGTPYGGYAGDGGPATEARFRRPRHITIDGHGNLIIADTENYRVREVYGIAAPGLIAGQPIPGSEIPAASLGDVDNDGSVTIKDVTLALQMFVGARTMTVGQKLHADMNGDGVLKIGDVLLLLQKAVGTP